MAKAKHQPKHASKASSKQTKQFKAKGHLQAQITARRKNAVFKKKVETRKMLKGHKTPRKEANAEPDEDLQVGPSGVEQLLQTRVPAAADSDDDTDEEEDDLASLDSFADDAATHKMDMKGLKEQDPEFYKYLLENDKALLEFDEDNEDETEMSDGEGSGGPKVVTAALLSDWQKALIATHSIKALRKLLLAFRAAASGDADFSKGQAGPAYVIQDAEVFQSLVRATLKFTPIVLSHHVPVKKLNNGKFKVQTQNKKYATVQRCIKSYFASLTSLFNSIPTDTSEDAAQGDSLAQLACAESAKLVPFIVGNRKVAKAYAKLMLDQWASSGLDTVKISAFIAVRTLALAGDVSLQELVLKAAYSTLISSFKQSTVYTMPALNLMKNSATELFLISSATVYQLAFTYIRQLALQLRSATKSQDKNAFQQVYNWQVVHAVDFWSLVLAAACDAERVATNGHSDLEALVFPLVQIALGVIKLLPTSRFFPLHLHIVKALLRLTVRTGTYIPLAPALLNMLNCSEFKRKPKPSTQLKNLDFEYAIRAPKAYMRTRTYADNLADELAFALIEVFEAQSKSIAFPEMVIPALITLKRCIKSSSSPRLISALKPVVEKLDANRTYIEAKRAKVEFTPADRSQVDGFLRDDDEETPLAAMLRRERKLRAKRRELMEKNADDDELMD